jgi:uncharacterized protein
MNEILFNSVGRLRSGWRFALYAVSFAIIYVFALSIVGAVALAITQDRTLSVFGTPAGLAVNAFISLTIATLLGWFYGKILEDLPLKALGWVFNKTWAKDFLLGLILGILAVTIAVVLAMPTGGIGLMFNSVDSWTAILLTFVSSFAVFFVAAAFEEVLFRGYLLQTLLRSNQTWLGILVTSILFAAVHNDNPSASSFSFLNTFIAGIWFGIAYLKTRSLWFVFGLHLAWNWFQGAFYGINVSGLTQIAPNPLFRAVDTGPIWLTGGHYGIEGGITCTIALIISTLLIWFLPLLKPTEDMLALTSRENPRNNLT